MDSYLIRIYRREKDNSEGIVGIIEEIGAEKKQSFGNLSEMTTIITKPKRGKRNRATGKRQGNKI